MIDPITLSVVRSGLEQICDEMDLHLIRSALSPIISETNDCAHGIYDPHSGETIAQGKLGLPIFLANMQFAVQAVIAEAARGEGLAPGDVWILNDTYRGGTHLNDVNLVVPVFVEDQLFALIASTGHWMDVGGGAPGGWNPHATEIHQEGTIIPPVRLFRNGRRNDALVDTVMANVRMPRDMLGDLTAMSSAVRRGEDGMNALVARYGADVVRQCQSELIERSERQMRSCIAEIPDGTYRFEDALDNDGIDDRALPIRVEIVVDGDELRADFTGTAPASRGPMNLARNSTVSMCCVALKHIFPEVPINGGTFRPIRVHVPDGTVASAEYPTPVGGYLEIAGRVLDVMFGALAQAIPDLVPAAPFGTTGVMTVGGVHPERQAFFVGVFPYPGGYGATASGDGLVHGNTPQSMANFVSLEASEHRYPVRFDYFALREDSGGAGMHRGGDGSTYAIRAWAPCLTSILGDRVDHAPFGLHGGGAAAVNDVRMVIGGQDVRPEMRSKVSKQPLEAGDVVIVASPGGGGFGDPLERDVAAVERDLNRGYVTPETAERSYAAVIASTELVAGRPRYRIDREATEQARTQRRQVPAHAGATEHSQS